MDHFYQDIRGWFNFKHIYEQAVQIFSDGSLFVEIGAWCGQSTAFMAAEIVNSGKTIEFRTIDLWDIELSPREKRHFQTQTLYQTFKENMRKGGVLGKVWKDKWLLTIDRGDSAEAALWYGDGEVDFIFIDGDHTAEGVRRDLDAWLPKMAPNGIMAGHDYRPEHHNYKGLVEVVNSFFKDIGGIEVFEGRERAFHSPSWVWNNNGRIVQNV